MVPKKDNRKKSKSKKKAAKKKKPANRKTADADKGLVIVKSKAKALVIVESPAKARTINKYLGPGYVVQASLGHVRDLPKSKLGIDIDNDFAPTYVDIPGKGVAQLRQAAKAASAVYLAPDPDREGEAIAWHLTKALKIPAKKAHRVTFNEITERAVKEGFQNPRPINMNLVYAQQARRILDRIVGYKLSPLLWKKITYGLSAGRVQSVALRMIVEREDEIQAFNPEEYWTITAWFSVAAAAAAPADAQEEESASIYAELRTCDGKKFVPVNKDQAMDVVRVANENKKAFVISAIKQKEVRNNPSPPFATSQLQQAASTRLGFTASRAMRVAQALYQGEVQIGGEGVGLITYMRTDSFRVAPEALDDCRAHIAEKYGDAYLPEKPNVYKAKKGAQEAHECIRPSDVRRYPELIKQYLTSEQNRLYDLIWRRFVASQMNPACFLATAVDLDCERYGFRANGRVMLFDGHLCVSGRTTRDLDRISEEDQEKGDEPDEPFDAKTEPEVSVRRVVGPPTRKKDPDQRLPELNEGQSLEMEEVAASQKFTKPAPRFSEASLVKTLEREGIGRPSTYAMIIRTIQDRNYVIKEGRQLTPTELGILVTRKLMGHFKSIMDYKFTRQLEEKLDKIEEAHVNWVDVLRDFNDPFTKDLEKAGKNMANVRDEAEVTDFDCPKCGAKLVKKFGRYGTFLGCTNYNSKPKCDHTAEIGEDGQPVDPKQNFTEHVCDECGGFMVHKRGRFGSFLGCEKYPECKNTMRIGRDGEPIKRLKPPTSEPIVKCDRCESDMVVRRARRSGKLFIGCSKYPRCRNLHPFPPPAEMTLLRELIEEEKTMAAEAEAVEQQKAAAKAAAKAAKAEKSKAGKKAKKKKVKPAASVRDAAKQGKSLPKPVASRKKATG